MEFKKIEELGEHHEEVIGFNKNWICEDFNPNGTRLCFQTDVGDLGWCSLRWNNDQDDWFARYDSAPTHYIEMPSTKSLIQ
ncbi:hypothetical protein MHM83_11015 [Tenacibaculum sp. Mcav3-52]|uniref:hypothetical protein n=1 Tax=Tenacibaculum sp. Mcav3-52 TaxID=2917762 RepID=UPI001EF1DEB4|nr:hypothetical protein [Tenacibaculum sp. Mcav3-52]MCG7502403.1 hypothetical protein [Tenacibaculum sp. Mcav3-52]